MIIIITSILLCLGGLFFYIGIKKKDLNSKLEDEQLKELEEKKIQLNQEIQHMYNDLQDKLHNNTEIVQNDLQLKIKQAENEFEKRSEELCENYQKEQEDLEYELNIAAEDMAEEVQKLGQSALEASNQIDQFRSTIQAYIRALQMQEEDEEKINYHKINLSEEDLKEVQMIRELAPKLRDPEPVNKIIWKVYYEKLFNLLVNRVIGDAVKTGIYKITNLNNQKCYIGQAVDIKNRFRTHIKRALGAEDAPAAGVSLYSAMYKDGIENFTFEILEECDRSLLNEREKYWIDFYQSQIYGYNQTKGGSAGWEK